MDGLILQSATRAQLERFIAYPSHALLLTGQSGIGKTAIAEALATALLGANLASYPYHLKICQNGQSISIEAIRELQKFLLLKTTGDRPLRRTILIEQAHTMTTEAQNAFLKLLEEPPADTLLILTATSARGLLPTILSRTQHITIKPPSEADLHSLLEQSKKNTDATRQAYLLSNGLPGLLTALLSDEDEHSLVANINLAKDALQKQPFQRLVMVDTLSKQKEAALGFVEAVERIAQTALAAAAAKADVPRIKQWHKIRKSALQARSALLQSANAKLTLDNFFLSL